MSDNTFDLVIAGSGGGGMIAALTAHHHGLKPLILEKDKYFGGTTARSGGVLWVPQNRHMAGDGVTDSEAGARAYLERIVDGNASVERQHAFVEYAPQMIDFLEEQTEVRMQSMPGYADYYPEWEGGKNGSRCIEARVFNGKKLGRLLDDMNPTIWEFADDYRMTGVEFHRIAMVRTSWRGKWTALKVGLRMGLDKLTFRKRLTMGNSLSAMLAYSLQKAGIPMWLNTRVDDLIVEDGKVVGVKAVRAGQKIDLRASKGVLFATGGFPHNQALRDRYHPPTSTSAWSLAHKGNTGDGITIAERHGAQLALMDEAWWGPMSILPGGTPFFHISERALPGSIMVNKDGHRFLNEAQPYNELVQEIHRQHQLGKSTIPAYFITDHRFRKHYAFGLMRAGKPGATYRDSAYVVSAPTLEALAEKVGIHPENLRQTVAEHNAVAVQGKDTRFGKGDSVYDRRFGDPSVRPNPCLAPLSTPPYYCSLMYPGDIGTKGGILTDEFARVLTTDGRVLEGFYATGNTTASVMGRSYPGAGATIAASMTFGFVAVKHMVGAL